MGSTHHAISFWEMRCSKGDQDYTGLMGSQAVAIHGPMGMPKMQVFVLYKAFLQTVIFFSCATLTVSLF